MGQTQSVHHEIEIERSPEEVRAVFLDFASYPEWFEYWTWTIEPDNTNKPPKDLQRGDKVKCIYRGSAIGCAVLINDAKSFQVQGSIGPFLKAHHQDYFEPSKVTKGGTKFVIHEDFTGLVSFALRRGSSGKADLDYTFEAFSASLKKRTENMPG